MSFSERSLNPLSLEGPGTDPAIASARSVINAQITIWLLHTMRTVVPSTVSSSTPFRVASHPNNALYSQMIPWPFLSKTSSPFSAICNFTGEPFTLPSYIPDSSAVK